MAALPQTWYTPGDVQRSKTTRLRLKVIITSVLFNREGNRLTAHPASCLPEEQNTQHAQELGSRSR
eukprot:scaffold2161_cov244-Pinguiococcus_pyrenoidosus.AAC.5